MGKLMIMAALSAFLALPLAAPPAVAAGESSTTATKRELTPGQIAERERQKKCAAEWKEAKAQGKIPPGMTWPKFWSDCNKRLKAQGQ